MAGHDGWKNQPRVPEGDKDGGQWTTVVKSAREGAGLVRKHRVLPGTEVAKLPEGALFYHVSTADPNSIMKKGLLKSSESAQYSVDETVDWELDHPVDGVFLANWGQAEFLRSQSEDFGLPVNVYEVYLAKGTLVYKDPMMPESSIQVEGNLSPRKIKLLEPGYRPWNGGTVTDTVLKNLKWKR